MGNFAPYEAGRPGAGQGQSRTALQPRHPRECGDPASFPHTLVTSPGPSGFTRSREDAKKKESGDHAEARRRGGAAPFAPSGAIKPVTMLIQLTREPRPLCASGPLHVSNAAVDPARRNQIARESQTLRAFA